MTPRTFLDVDSRTLHLPTSRRSGADPYKLQRQIARHGASVQGMPVLEVSRGSDGELVINNVVVRATRVAKLLPGVTVRVEMIDDLPIPVGNYPREGGCVAMTTVADELVGAIVELRVLFPEWRVAQLVASLAMAAGRDGQVWEVEDEELLTAARRLLERNWARQAVEV